VVEVTAVAGSEQIAMVYIADFGQGRAVEFVESIQPPLPREKKWVLMVSTLFGCPVKCLMCDAGGSYQGKLSCEEILAQIDYLVKKRFPGDFIPVEKFKIQFARMGEPSFNPSVLDVLTELPDRYHAAGLIPSLSTIAPRGVEHFFERLLDIKERLYSNGNFQFQFSLHTTNNDVRDRLIPVKKWSFAEMAEYGNRFYKQGDRKITLNFALAKDTPIAPEILSRYFDPDKYVVKITPLNPTCEAVKNGLSSYLDPYEKKANHEIVTLLADWGYEVIVAIGEVEENQIGSNCGQYLLKYLDERTPVANGYTYQLQPLSS
jgi:23S rRNA (adenine2503-C2)-methyltransferase